MVNAVRQTKVIAQSKRRVSSSPDNPMARVPRDQFRNRSVSGGYDACGSNSFQSLVESALKSSVLEYLTLFEYIVTF